MNTSESAVKPATKCLCLRITPKCNMSCSWCCAAKGRGHTELDIPWTDITMEKLWQYYGSEKENITFISITGGEPLLEYPRIMQIIRRIRDTDKTRGARTSILIHTNASLLTGEMRDFFNKNKVSINISVKIRGEKGLDNLARKARVGAEIFNLIRTLDNYAIRYVVLRKEEYAEDVLQMHRLFPNADVISVATDQTAYDEWTDEDVEHELAQMTKLYSLAPDLVKWCAHCNTLGDTVVEKQEFISFHGTGDVTYSHGKGNAVYETNELFGMPQQYVTRLREGMMKILTQTTVTPKIQLEKLPQIPLSIQILTNLDCNLRCTYCYECKGKGRNESDYRAFIKSMLTENSVQGTNREVILELIGGESLLYPAYLDKICTAVQEIMDEMGCTGPLTISLSTNGTLIAENKDVQDFLRKWRPHIGFSVDGTREIHDACRLDAKGKGSYDRAVAGWEWTKTNLCPRRLGVKATYCHETIDRWAEGVINLINLGFTEIAANVVFEEIWTLDDAMTVADQMIRVVDYLFDNGLEDKVHIFQINHGEMNMLRYNPESGPKTTNHCGTCTHMRCLGFDGKVYGCNRFCTMKEPIPIGYTDNKGIKITNPILCEEVAKQYDVWPEECKKCEYGQQCPSCSAIPYEQDGPEAFFARKPQCGFTHAMVAARLYFQNRLLEKEAQDELAPE